jgi:hypothetical protein
VRRKFDKGSSAKCWTRLKTTITHHTTCPSPPATHCAGLSARHVSRSLPALVWHCNPDNHAPKPRQGCPSQPRARKEGDLLCHSPKRLKHSTREFSLFHPKRNPSQAEARHLVWSQRVARGRGLSAGGGPQPRSHVEEASVRGMAPPTPPARCRKCRCFQSFCGRDTKARWLFLPLHITLRARTQHRGG